MNAMDALVRCQRAWEATQPQLFMDFDGLDWGGFPRRDQPSPVEPVAPHANPGGSPSSGLDADVAQLEEHRASSPEGAGSTPAVRSGAEPCRDHRGLTAETRMRLDSPSAAPAPAWAGSAPSSNTTGPDAPPAKGARPAQRRSV